MQSAVLWLFSQARGTAPVLSYINPLHIHPVQWRQSILISTLVFQSDAYIQVSNQSCVWYPDTSHALCFPRSPQPLSFNYPNDVWREVKIMKLLITQFSTPSFRVFPCPKITVHKNLQVILLNRSVVYSNVRCAVLLCNLHFAYFLHCLPIRPTSDTPFEASKVRILQISADIIRQSVFEGVWLTDPQTGSIN